MSLLRKIFKTFQRNQDNSVIVSPADNRKITFNKNREPALQGSVCFAPSVNMIFSEDGQIKACCHNSENSLGRYPGQTISEIWNSEEANRFRQKMSDYQFLSGCSVCEKDYQTGNFEEMSARHFDDLPRNSAYPTMMEFMLSNTCNLECIMCTGELSSSIRKNRDKLPPIKSPYDDGFVEQLKEFIPHLVETRFSSAGEAFLIDMNFRFWEMLIEANPQCLIVVQTNGTVLNGRVKDFMARGNFKIGVSLDSLQKETFEAIRVNASFDRVMKNIRYFAEYSKANKRPFTISTCVMRQNWKELPDFIRFCNEMGASATFHKVWLPLQYALHNLPTDELQAMYEELSRHDFPVNSALEKKNRNHYQYFVSLIGDWASEAKHSTAETPDLHQLSTSELLQLIKHNFETYIAGQQMLENDKQQLLSLCGNKIDKIMALCTNEDERKVRLVSLASTPVSFSLPAIKTHSVEKLFEMSGNQVKV